MGDISKLVVQGTLYDIKDTIARSKADAAAASVEGVIAQATGSTSGNAELLDIRNGYEGTTYTTAGAAVRGQVTNLNTRLSATESKVGAIVGLTLTQMNTNWNNG